MKLYRAIEFSKIQYLLDTKAHLFWIEKELGFVSDKKVNWWMEDDPKTVKDRYALISSVMKNSKDKFFEISAEFNSINGGRFNPRQSFGALYSSNHQLVAALEVLYHQFESIYGDFRSSSKNKARIHTNFNRPINDKVEVKIVVFEFNVQNENANFYRLNSNQDDLEKDCSDHGFDRYLTTTFDRDFIFGNDYFISQVLGCSIHSKNSYHGISVPSARIDFSMQDDFSPPIRNIVIPERAIEECDFKFTKRFQEFHFEVECDQNANGRHNVLLILKGTRYIFEIQTFPERKTDKERQIKCFEHITENIGERKLREVVTQKFK
jgi:hypothetical protein